jgi:RNA polymerase sigma factor (sigma-70 family)
VAGRGEHGRQSPADDPPPEARGRPRGQRRAAPEQPLDASILKELAALPERQRLVIFLRYYADLDYTMIAAALGISTGTVGSTLNSAHQTLRRQLAEEGRQ